MRTIFGFAPDNDGGDYELRTVEDYPFTVVRGDTVEWPGYGETRVSHVMHLPWGEDGQAPHRYVVVRP